LKRLTKLMALLAVAAALFAAGCGDDDDDTASSTTTTEAGATGGTGVEAESKEQWVATADEVCANADDEINAAAEAAGLSNQSTPQELQEFTETTVVPVQQSVIDTLSSLAPPEGEEEQVSAILDEVQSALDAVSSDPELLADPEASDAAFDEADALAQDYGLQECGAD
jgi:hypothetical protein